MPKNKLNPSAVESALIFIAVLQERFPGAFPVDRKLPLKIGIFMDLFQSRKVLNVSKVCLLTSLHLWVNDTVYYQCLQAGANRYNLQGEVSGIVTELEAANAWKKLQDPSLRPRFPRHVVTRKR